MGKYDDFPIDFYEDPIVVQAPFVDRGVLIEVDDSEVYVYSQVEDDDLAALLERALRSLRG